MCLHEELRLQEEQINQKEILSQLQTVKVVH